MSRIAKKHSTIYIGNPVIAGFILTKEKYLLEFYDLKGEIKLRKEEVTQLINALTEFRDKMKS